MASNLDVRFYCSRKVLKAGKKSRHEVLKACPDVMKVLALKPDYGNSISGFADLHKMRVRVPGYNVGKRSGYRLVYSKATIGEVVYIAFLSTYSKSKKEDLTHEEYQEISSHAESIFSDPLAIDWQDVPI